MSTVFDILQKQEPWGTLPSFSHLRLRLSMARLHVHLPDSIASQLEAACTRLGMRRSKFVAKSLMMALDDANKTFGDAANDPAPVPESVLAKVSTPVPVLAAPKLSLVASSGPEEEDEDEWDDIQLIRRGPVVWFCADTICKRLGIAPADMSDVLDWEDDTLKYIGKDWIDINMVEMACDISIKSNRHKVYEWACAQLTRP